MTEFRCWRGTGQDTPYLACIELDVTTSSLANEWLTAYTAPVVPEAVGRFAAEEPGPGKHFAEPRKVQEQFRGRPTRCH